MSREWRPQGERPHGQPKPKTVKPKVEYPKGNFATEADLAQALGLVVLANPQDGSPMLGIMMGPDVGMPIDPAQAFQRGVLLGRGWKSGLRVSEKDILASEQTDPLT